MPDPNLFQNPPTMAAQHMVWSNVSGHPPSSEVLQVKVVKTMDGKTANEAATGLFVRGSEADSTPLLLQLAEELSRLRRDITQLQEGQLKVTAKNEALTAELKASRESTASLSAELKASRESTASLSAELDESRESTRDAHSRLASLSAELDASRDDLEAARLEREVLRNNVAKQNTLLVALVVYSSAYAAVDLIAHQFKRGIAPTDLAAQSAEGIMLFLPKPMRYKRAAKDFRALVAFTCGRDSERNTFIHSASWRAFHETHGKDILKVMELDEWRQARGPAQSIRRFLASCANYSTSAEHDESRCVGC